MLQNRAGKPRPYDKHGCEACGFYCSGILYRSSEIESVNRVGARDSTIALVIHSVDSTESDGEHLVHFW